MARLLFEKTGRAVWISHLDLMRLFQRAFKRAGMTLKHTQGYNPRPTVSIALPLSVGMHSCCELLDFEIENENIAPELIKSTLNHALVDGIRVLDVYQNGRKLKDLSLLRCVLTLEYDAHVAKCAAAELSELFNSPSLTVEKKGKNGVIEQDIIPLVRSLKVNCENDDYLTVETVICCQNPSLNPMQLIAAIERYRPELKPDHVVCKRLEIMDAEEQIFR